MLCIYRDPNDSAYLGLSEKGTSEWQKTITAVLTTSFRHLDKDTYFYLTHYPNLKLIFECEHLPLKELIDKYPHLFI